MKVKLIIRRVPFLKVSNGDGIIMPFYFQPHLIRSYTDETHIHELILAIPRVREFYSSVISTISSIPSVKFLEMEHEITLSDEELQLLIAKARELGIKLRWYVEILPLISEQEFYQLQKQAERKPPAKIISQVLQSHHISQ
jgi:hypothetical protein